MNKFRTNQMSPLIEEIRTEVRRVKSGQEAGQVRDLVAILADAADSLSDAHEYYCAVEGALT